MLVLVVSNGLIDRNRSLLGLLSNSVRAGLTLWLTDSDIWYSSEWDG